MMCGKSPLTKICNSLDILTFDDIIRLTELNALKITDLLCYDENEITKTIKYIKLNEKYFKQLILINKDVKKNKVLKRSRSFDEPMIKNYMDSEDHIPNLVNS